MYHLPSLDMLLGVVAFGGVEDRAERNIVFNSIQASGWKEELKERGTKAGKRMEEESVST